jgi:hypothetical protein
MLLRTVRLVLPITAVVALGLWCRGGLGAQAPAPGQRPPAARPAPRPPAKTGAAPTRTERGVPFAVGETLTYDIGWANYLTAGTATLAVREKRPSFGSVAYYVTAEGQPVSFVAKLYPLYYKVDTLLDAYSLLPQRASTYSDENGRQKMKTTLFDQAKRSATYEVRARTTTTQAIRLPPETHDALSAIYAIRSLALQTGTRIDLPVVDSGEVMTVRVTVVGRESVRSALGDLDAWRVEPAILQAGEEPAAMRKLAIWLTDDGRRLPVKMTAETAFGPFSFVLRRAGPEAPN